MPYRIGVDALSRKGFSLLGSVKATEIAYGFRKIPCGGQKMGGYGSGPRWRRSTVEETLGLKIGRLHREGCLRPGWQGVWSWLGQGPGHPDRASIGIVTHSAENLVISYTVRTGDQAPKRLMYPLHVRWVCCPYGGERPWWLCPMCGRQVATLYLGGRDLRCRHCYRLVYTSTQASGTIDRPRQQIMKLRRQLKRPPIPPYGFGDSDGDVERPRYMHQTRYHRLRKELAAAQAQETFLFDALMNRFRRRGTTDT